MELTVDQALQQGVTAHEEGKLQDAERLYRAILQAQPKHPDANHNLGVLAVAVGKPLEAIPLFKLALEANPQIEQFWLSYIDVLIRLERFEEAKPALVKGEESGVSSEKLEAFRQRLQVSVPNESNKTAHGPRLSDNRKKLAERKKSKKKKAQGSSSVSEPSQDQLNRLLENYQAGRLAEAEALATSLTQQVPEHPFGWKVLGSVIKQMGRLEESLAPKQKATMLAPQDADAHNNLGITLKELGRLDEAEASYRKAIALEPDYAEAYNNLGITLKKLGRLGEAEAGYRRAIVLKPDFAEAHYNLGATLKERGRLDKAEASYKQAIALKTDYVEAHYNLALTLQELRRVDAETSYRRAIALKPDHAEAHSNLGITLQKLGRLNEAESSHRQAIALKPDYAEAHSNLGVTLQELGRLEESEASHRQAIALKPDFIQAWDNLLFVLNYLPRLSAAELYREYEAYGSYISSVTTQHFDHGGGLSVSGRRIRIGYSSPDFRGHACRFFMEPMIRAHNRDEFELFAYSNTAMLDSNTDRFKRYFDEWVDVTQLSDEAMAERIYNDGIDILVDVAGHTKGNRLPVFAMRPAPIQVGSATGYGYTTGLTELDYFICDEHLTPDGSESFFSETLWRVQAPALVYAPPRDVTPEVSRLPALQNGYVTFGSLTRTVRLNDPLFTVWKVILERVPGSRLRLDQKPFAKAETRELFWARLESLDIPRERVELTCSNPHWDAYKDIDIALDCWPHNAGTTTVESLWMGVPVLTKVDRPSMGCIGASILRPLGLGAWVVEDETAYIEKAVANAADLTALAQLRATLRLRLEESSLLDAARLTQNLESTYRQMLNKIVEKKP